MQNTAVSRDVGERQVEGEDLEQGEGETEEKKGVKGEGSRSHKSLSRRTVFQYLGSKINGRHK